MRLPLFERLKRNQRGDLGRIIGIKDGFHVIGVVGGLALNGPVAVLGNKLPEGFGDQIAFAAFVHGYLNGDWYRPSP